MWKSERRRGSRAEVTAIAWKLPPWCTMPVSGSMSGLSVAVKEFIRIKYMIKNWGRARTGIAFNSDGLRCSLDRLELRADPLRCRTQRVTVLPECSGISVDRLFFNTHKDVLAVHATCCMCWSRLGMTCSELRSLKKVRQKRSGFNLYVIG